MTVTDATETMNLPEPALPSVRRGPFSSDAGLKAVAASLESEVNRTAGGNSAAMAAVDEYAELDMLIVQTSLRNTITLAQVHFADGKPHKLTPKLVRLENAIMTMLKKEFKPGVDYSGGKEEKK